MPAKQKGENPRLPNDEAAETFRIVICGREISLPLALLRDGKLLTCHGCVDRITYGSDGSVLAFDIKWLEQCGNHAKGTTTHFSGPSRGLLHAAERAQDNCLGVTVSFKEITGPQGNITELELHVMATDPKNDECCKKQSDEGKGEGGEGKKKWF